MRKIDISKIVLLSIMVLLPVMGKAQTFKHYEGIANKAGDYEVIDASTGCYRQKTHEYHYYVPVKAGVATALSLPIVKFMQNVGDALEPRGFFRYYNYDTDMKSDHLTAYASGSNKLKEMSDGKGYSKGLVAYNIGVNAVYNTVGVNYTRPKDANWTGETVACDVSRYVDGCENGTFTHEPTLSMRYIFHMIPAEKFADDLQTAILNGVGSRVNDLTYEDNKEMSVGFKDGKSQLTLRLNFNDITHYFFHPMKDLGKHHVYYNDDQYQIKESYFDKNSLMQANAILWRVYNTDKTMCKSFWNGNGRNHGRFFTLTLNDLNSGGWYYLRNSQVPNNKTPSFSYGSRAYVVAYAYNTSNPYVGCPIANFTVTFYNHYPMTAEQLRSHSQNTRLIDYLDDHYRAVAKVSFDDDDIEMTKFAPTTPTDNQAPLPSSWQKRSYGFVYPQLINKTAPGSSNDKWHNPQHSPIHGEYGLYKSANVRGISGAGESFTNNYLWYQGGTLHDRTYESTNGAQYGSFLYIDAADESRQIAEADFKANLCAGSQVIFSSAISDMTSGEVKPEVLFKLYGVHYDETTGKETDRKLLHSFSTGYLQGNVDDYGTCKWYQGYGKMVLQKESGVNNYENFKIVVDNLCQGTSGADYAFDDLRIYTQTAKVNVLQSKPICPDVDMNKGDSSSAMGNIKLKIRALQATMTALAEHQDKKLYFRFVDNDGNVAKDVNYGTESEPNTQWGTTTIYNEVDAGKTVDGSKMYEKIDDEWYVNLANRNFNLDPNKTYYVSMAFDDESIKDKNNLNWGKPSDVCSLYSETFKLVQQSVVVSDVNGNIATQVTIPCEKNQAPTYNIKAQIQTVDQNNGGSIKLQSIKFNWYVDSTHGEPVLRNSSEFKNVPLTEGEHTIYVEPTNASDTITEGGVSYEICLGMMSFKLRAVKNGPKLAFGFRDVVLPSNYTTTVRVGLPQIKALAEQAKTNAQSGYLEVPVSSMKTVADNSKNLLFVKYNGDKTPFSTIYLSGTNDPTYQNRLGEGLKLAELQSTTLPLTASTMGVKFQLPLHEGYWYEGILVFNEDGSAGTTVLCSGEAYLRFEVVPEYVTWNPTARNKMSAAWNNDQNWIRSTRSELYKSKDEYKDYVGSSASTSQDDEAVDRMNSYVPMKFTKVVIPNLSGLCFPDLGYIAYQKSNGIATRLSNAKGDEETTNIQYSIMAKWDANAANHGLDNDGNLACEKFYGLT